jgi:hypothetical protein
VHAIKRRLRDEQQVEGKEKCLKVFRATLKEHLIKGKQQQKVHTEDGALVKVE